MLRPDSTKSLNALKLNLLDDIWLDEDSGMPSVDRCDDVPVRLISFRTARQRPDHRGTVHFYIEDYKFSHLWTNPTTYLNMLSQFDSVIAPDFSTYLDMPPPVVRWQIYRRRLLAQWLQRSGVKVIYNVHTLQRCYDNDQFSGIKKGGVAAMKPPLNFVHNQQGRLLFYDTISELDRRLSPKCLLIYGKPIGMTSSINVKFYENENLRLCKTLAKKERRLLDKGIPQPLR